MSPTAIKRSSWPGLTIIISFVGFLFLANAVHAVEPEEMLKDPALEARARAVTAELRCLVCQNQSVDDSDAPLAKDIRVLVRERIAKGDTDEQVRDFIVARYGKYVLLRPPFETDTLVIWLGPIVLLMAGLALAYAYVRRLNRSDATPKPLTSTEEDAVKRMLEDTR